MGRSKRSERAARRPPRPRLGGALALLGGLVGLILAAVVFAGVPDVLTEAEAYDSAVACPSAGPLPAGDGNEIGYEDCLREVPYTVVEVSGKGARSSGYLVDLANGSERVRVGFDSDPPLGADLRKGDRVTARVWRGEITAVSGRGSTQPTDEDPDTASEWRILLGLALTAGGLFALWYGRRLLRPGRVPAR
ncbi:hypothetical protein ACFXD5_30240 [Streptomyces sp. NPDC059385]|uniref:hypothetical protein n=1 Tax=Streptomyces sp. NPDC059385 TaxID=3346817 RepID=UPI003699D2EB